MVFSPRRPSFGSSDTSCEIDTAAEELEQLASTPTTTTSLVVGCGFEPGEEEAEVEAETKPNATEGVAPWSMKVVLQGVSSLEVVPVTNLFSWVSRELDKVEVESTLEQATDGESIVASEAIGVTLESVTAVIGLLWPRTVAGSEGTSLTPIAESIVTVRDEAESIPSSSC